MLFRSLPNQLMYNLDLDYQAKDLENYSLYKWGLHHFNLSSQNNVSESVLFSTGQTVHSIINKEILKKTPVSELRAKAKKEKYHILFVSGCNTYNENYMDHYITEKIYIYYNFLKILNNTIIEKLSDKIDHIKLNIARNRNDCNLFIHHKQYQDFVTRIEFPDDLIKNEQVEEVNIQNERRGKVLRLPFEIESKSEKIIVRVSGPQGDLFVEDYLPYKGESEWLEIDSNEITYFLADHQDQLDTIEIMYE